MSKKKFFEKKRELALKKNLKKRKKFNTKSKIR